MTENNTTSELITVLEFVVPTVEVDVEHHDGARGEAGHQKPAEWTISARVAKVLSNNEDNEAQHNNTFKSRTRSLSALLYKIFKSNYKQLNIFGDPFRWITKKKKITSEYF